MQRRYYPIAILTALLCLAALAGYLLPAEAESPPKRVLLENKGGKVIFTHASHMETMDQDCVTCHHTSQEDQTPPTCSSCHAKKFDEIFIANHPDEIDESYCISCHHPKAGIDNFSHDDHVNDYAPDDCQACHHDKSIEEEPQSCSNCHTTEGTEEIISLKKANHTRCADCHDDLYSEGIKGCGNCHVREELPKEEPETIACSSCHETKVDLLVPTKTNAFHDQCRGCHEKEGSGPFGDDACFKCHMQ